MRRPFYPAFAGWKYPAACPPEVNMFDHGMEGLPRFLLGQQLRGAGLAALFFDVAILDTARLAARLFIF